MIIQLPVDDIKKAAEKYELDWRLLGAIVIVESGARPEAFRYEPNFINFVKVKQFALQNRVTEESERNFQKISIGLVQIMGASARGLGFQGLLPELFHVQTNLEWGARYLKYLSRRFEETSDVISAYNAGYPRKSFDGTYLNQAYVDKVLGFIRDLGESA